MEEELVFEGVVKQNNLIEEGTYEVTLSAEWAKTRAGSDYIKLTYAIRKDVEQNEQGRLVFDGIYRNKETGKFSSIKIEAILATIPDKDKQLRFKNYDELIQYINGLNMIIEVQTEKADKSKNPDAQDRSICKYLSNKPTVAGPVFSGVVSKEVEEDEDIPF